MSQITEPLSKCELLASIRAHAKTYVEQDQLHGDAVCADDWVKADLHLEASSDAFAELAHAVRQAEESGLMDELAGYLATTYGG